MSDTMKLRGSGIEIPKDEFGQIYGGGVKKGREKARAEEHFVNFGEAKIGFSLDDMNRLQSVCDLVYREHQTMQLMLGLSDDEVASLKPRFRVKAGSAPHLSVVPPSLASRLPGAATPKRGGKRGKAADPAADRRLIANAPKKRWCGKFVTNYAAMTPEHAEKVRKAVDREKIRNYRERAST